MGRVSTVISEQMVATRRIRTRVLTTGPADAEPVLFLHGNASSATWWESVLGELPDAFHAMAPDLRGYGAADPEFHVNATRGMDDHVEDAIALMDELGHERFHVVGSSLGGVVIWAMMAGEHSQRLLTVTQAAPGSPYGFGATKGEDGQPVNDDYAGSGAGLVNPEFVERLEEGDRTAESPFSPLSVLRFLTARPLDEAIESRLLDALLSTHLGNKDYPGDVVASSNWPHVAPGDWGSTNALSPKHLEGLVDRIIAQESKPPVLWIRGDSDVVVSDNAASDPGTWGPTGLVPGYPGRDEYPPQPMLAQTRAFLGRYVRSGGIYEEVVIDGCGHIPYVEKTEEFIALLGEHARKKTNDK